MGMFTGMSKVQLFSKALRFQQGLYVVRIDKVKERLGGHTGDYLIVEAEVLGAASEHPEAPKVGLTASQTFSMSGPNRSYGLSDLTGFMCAAMGCGQNDYSDEEWEGLVEEAKGGALSGIVMYLECFGKVSQNGHPYVIHNWKRQATVEDKASFGI